VREIESLARGYFRGPPSLREAIDEGKWSWALDRMKRVPEPPEGCNAVERKLLKDLQMLEKYVQRVTARCHDERLQSPAFRAQANLLAASLLSKWEPFSRTMREFHDRSGQA
jgi:hypothetical protein